MRYLRLFWIYIKTYGEKTVNPSIIIYLNKIEKRVTFKVKKRYYLELLTPETITLLASTKSKIMENENVKMFLIYKLLK